jgi:integrase
MFSNPGSILVDTPKENNKQYIPLSDIAIEIVKKHIKGKFKTEFVFINPVTGKGYMPETLSKYWKLNAGVEVSYYEASRHSFCTQVVEDCNVNEFQAQLLMRHADPRSTRRYFHGNVKRLRDIVNKER